jgi:hypothetical protein
MIDWKVVLDWAPIVISAIAIIVSLITLYVAHLRGPNIQLADPGDTYPISDFSLGTKAGRLDLNFLIVNAGIRSGILFSLSIPTSNFIYDFYYKDNFDSKLPMIIPSGQGKNIKIAIAIAKAPDKTWIDILNDYDYLPLEVNYKSSTSFPWNRNNNEKFKIDISNLKEFASYGHTS